MILLLGSSGYIGQAFEVYLQQQNIPFIAIKRHETNYLRYQHLLGLLKKLKPSFVVNCAGYTGKPNVDACEEQKAETLLGNMTFPQILAQACDITHTPFGHISSGCIYQGAWVKENSEWNIVRNLNTPKYRSLAELHPENFRGFKESDTPNFSFRFPPCSFYSASKALAEEVLSNFDNHYIWRLRIPFDHLDHPRNFLSKIQIYPKVYDNLNSLSNRFDFVRACVQSWQQHLPFGIYNITNPGFVSTRQVIAKIQNKLNPHRTFEFWSSDEEFYLYAAKTPRSNCIMDVSKIIQSGIHLDDIETSLDKALHEWQPA